MQKLHAYLSFSRALFRFILSFKKQNERQRETKFKISAFFQTISRVSIDFGRGKLYNHIQTPKGLPVRLQTNKKGMRAMDKTTMRISNSTLTSLCDEFKKNNRIEPEKFEKYEVKRGLRNADVYKRQLLQRRKPSGS